jgi:hypothetical protein
LTQLSRGVRDRHSIVSMQAIEEFALRLIVGFVAKLGLTSVTPAHGSGN